MEEWVTLILRRRDALVCNMCAKTIENQQVHMYVDVDYEVEEVYCEECWEKERSGEDEN
jgi:hypothetical protein